MFRWQSCDTFCLFNLEACDINHESRGGISCHWGSGSTPNPRSTQDMVYTQPIFICVSQMVKHNILTASSSRVSEGQRGKWRPIPARISKSWLGEIGWFDKWPKYFWQDSEYITLLTSRCSSVLWVFFRLHQVYLEERTVLWFQGLFDVERNILKHFFLRASLSCFQVSVFYCLLDSFHMHDIKYQYW